MDLNIEIEEFKTAWLSSGGHFKFYEYNPKFSKFEPTGFNGTLTQEELQEIRDKTKGDKDVV